MIFISCRQPCFPKSRRIFCACLPLAAATVFLSLLAWWALCHRERSRRPSEQGACAAASASATLPSSEPPATEGAAGLKARPGERFRVNVNLVLIPLTVTDSMDRLVTGLEKENFFIFEDNRPEKIKSFSTEDAPASIGVIFDMSGSMADKIIRARDSILEFMKTSNPQDEFFVVGFNDRPELIKDFTSSTSKLKSGWRL